MSDVDEKTRVTSILATKQEPVGGRGDCLVTIYAKESSQLGKRYVLEVTPTMIGRGHDSFTVLQKWSTSAPTSSCWHV